MTKHQNIKNPVTSAELRLLAEERLKLKQPSALDITSSPEEMLRMIHELSVHQIELEMQQEKLAKSSLEMEECLSRYTELYDFAPTGYVTLGRDSKIQQANLTATRMLGVDRSHLQGMWFKKFIEPADYRIIDELLDTVFTNKAPGNCELRLLANPFQPSKIPVLSPRTVRIDAAMSDTEHSCRIMLSDITAQKVAEEGLRKSERNLHAITENIQEVVVVADGTGTITNVSKVAEATFGFLRDEIVGHSFTDYMAESDIPAALKVLNDTLLYKTTKQVVEFKLKRKNGSLFDAEIHLQYFQNEAQNGFICLIMDISDQKQAENELHRLNRALKATNSCNLALIHATDEIELLQKICSVMVDIGGYRMAWVGYVEHDEAKSIRQMAHAGFEHGYTNTSRITWADTELGNGPIGIAIRTGHPSSKLDIINNPLAGQWQQEAISRGFTSIQCFPLKKGDKVFGAITIYSELQNAFNAEEITLLAALADNLAYGITMLRTREAKQRSDDKLKLSEEHFRMMFEEHTAIKLVIDPDTGAIIDANNAAAGYYGWSVEKLCTMHIQDINTTSPEEYIGNLKQVRSRGRNQFSFQHRRADGSLRDVEVFTNVITIGGKDLIFSIIHDVTERKLAEAKVLEIKERFLATIDAAEIGTWEWNIQTGEAAVNDRWFEMIGYTPEDFPQVTLQIWENITHPDDFAKAIEVAEKHFKGEFEHYESECRMKNKNGQWIWILDRGKLMTRTPDGKPLRMLGTHIDITERKLAAEESDRLKTAFIANISHEIRTPMNGILGFTELLKDPHLADEDQAEYIDLIHQSGQRMLNLVNDLMDISKIDAKEVKLEISETPVNQILRELNAFFTHEANKKGLRLTCTAGLSDRDSIILSDSVKLNQIVTNLIQNSLKFTTKGGIDFGYSKKDDKLEFYCIDSGIGIPLDKKEKIFERFHQVDNSLSRNHEGAGLGLSITKAFVDMMGGTLLVESSEGAGSKFSFTLPYTPAPAKVQQEGKTSQLVVDKHSELCMLIAEDDDVSTLLLKKNLKNDNVTIITAGNGWEAVNLVEHHPEINLVLMDIKMPVMNGFEATRLIKELRPDLPVIAQSAFTSQEDRDKAKHAGCDRFITKPIRKSELLTMMQELLHW